ncbi:MAG: cytochrome c oxidase subunit 3 [Acidimicrobiales bacterium]
MTAAPVAAPVTDIIPSDVPAAEPTRPRVVLIGTALVIAAIAALFTGLFAVYFSTRAGVIATGEDWIPGGAGTIPLTPASVMFVTLGMSMVTIQWGVWAIGKNDRLNAYLAFGLSLMLAGAFLNQAAFLYGEMGWEIAGDLAVQSVLIYAITGTHILMTVLAMIYVALMVFRALAGEFSSRDREGITAAALFWHASVAAYAVIWVSIYQIK